MRMGLAVVGMLALVGIVMFAAAGKDMMKDLQCDTIQTADGTKIYCYERKELQTRTREDIYRDIDAAGKMPPMPEMPAMPAAPGMPNIGQEIQDDIESNFK